MTHPDDKFEALASYLASRLSGGAQDPQLGAALYLAEFGHVRTHGQGITAHEFLRTVDGPSPAGLEDVRERLAVNGDGTALDADERRSADEAIDALCGGIGTQAAELLDDPVAWQPLDVGEVIPRNAAYLCTTVITEEMRQHVLMLLEQRGVA